MIAYDSIWETFLNNYKAEDIDLPSENEQIYQAIGNAVMFYNNRLRTLGICDDAIEMVTGLENNHDTLLLIAHYIKLVFLNNDLTFYEKLWQPLSSDVGLKNFRNQLSSLASSIKAQEVLIEKFIFNAMEDFL